MPELLPLRWQWASVRGVRASLNKPINARRISSGILIKKLYLTLKNAIRFI
jgi:hypothetical protein